MRRSLVALSIATFLTSTATADVRFCKTDLGCKIDIGAEVFFEGGTRVQNKKNAKYDITKNNQDVGFNSNVAAHLTVEHETVNNWTYGMQAGLKTNTKAQSKAGKHYLDRTYMWADHDNFGKLEIGSNVSAASSMQIKGDNSGSWKSYASLNTNDSAGNTAVNSSNFLSSPKLVFKETSFEEAGSHERSRKVTYYTPKFNGLQFGISYIPDVTNSGSNPALPNSETAATRQENNAIASGITFEKKINADQKIKLAVVGETATVKRTATDRSEGRYFHRSKSLSIGTKYNYKDLQLEFSYGNHWKTNTQKVVGQHIPNAHYYNLGAKYSITDKTDLKSSVFYGEKFKNPMIVAAIGANHNLVQGVELYTTLTYFNMDQKNTYTKAPTGSAGDATLTSAKYRNEGTILVLGTRFKF